uniref:Cytochrome c oxidase subunit 2 n=1 Tax=Imerinia grandidieri TaxID=3244470 RepID=G8HQX7_9EUPU|nr:cytochrome c oxidase subunit II [Rhopalocaulis grandidieri]
MSLWGQLNLLDPSSVIQAEMLLFHDHAMVILISIFCLVSFMGVKILANKLSVRTIHEAQDLESIWTILPAITLLFLALPSLRLLYLIDEEKSGLPVKVTGRQWYWSYQVGDQAPFDSFLIREKDLALGDYRLLEVDSRLSAPLSTDLTILCSSADVLHSWALPSAGMKLDAVPGRLNSMGVFFNYSGVFYGQCSEICGANHSFMPIAVEVL